MTLRTEHRRLSLTLERPFTIARGTTTERTVHVVSIRDDDGSVGRGAAAPAPYYGETPETVADVLPSYLEIARSIGDPHALDRIERTCRETEGEHPSALAAVTTALLDLVTTRLGLPLYQYLGLDPQRAPPTAHTVGIASPGEMEAAAAEAAGRGFQILKVKLGADDPLESLQAVRSGAPNATLVGDANGAWSPAEALEHIEALADCGLSHIEQPVPGPDLEGLEHVHEHSPIPVLADESCVTAADVPQVAGRCSGVVLKLMKCGGPPAAIRLAHTARAHGLSVMGGCMVESNVSIAAAWHLAPLFDFADLDGALLLADDPYNGVPLDGDTPLLAAPERSGTGVIRGNND